MDEEGSVMREGWGWGRDGDEGGFVVGERQWWGKGEMKEVHKVP